MPSSARHAARARARRALLCVLLAASAPLAAQTEVTGFGSNPGNLRMFKYVPAALPPGSPLVVALHGCSQSAASYDAETGWQMLADRWHFALLLPQQQNANNSATCFNWFEAGDIARGQGEALSIRQMIDRMLADHAGAPSRVYVTGLSAGGAMAAVMLATYPETFAGGAIVAGIPYRCGVGQTAALSCMNPGTDLTPAQWGDKVRAASSWTGPWPPVSIWHGDADFTVRSANLTELMQQWTNVHGVDQSADVSDAVAGQAHKVYTDTSGVPRVETYVIAGMGHGTPVDPGSGETQCGTAGAFVLDVNLCSSYYIGRFWGIDDLDGTPPAVALTAPSDASVVSGTVALAATASDDVAVDRVEFLLDGSALGSDASAPYSLSWNAATTSNGAHVLQARAFDTAGNVGHSAPVGVTVTGGGGGGTPVTLVVDNEDANDGYVKANASGGSASVGTLESFYGLAIGRGTDGLFNRALLSFDTSAIPDGATITGASVSVAYRSASGNPWTNPAGNTLLVDAHGGCLGNCAIEATDWSAATTTSGVAQIAAFTGGSQTSTLFSAAGLGAVNRTGRTQLRLRFSANPTSTNYVWIDRGASATLSVTYLP